MPRKMKRQREEEPVVETAKKTKLLDENSEAEDTFKINEDFAKRFEHNNKRKELQQLEEKYGKNNVKFTSRQNGADGSDEEEDDSESSSDEDEDDDGEFATADLDAEINDTLNAIRSKDPRVYDSSAKFYREFEEPTAEGKPEAKEKAMTLKDYHRANFLAAANGTHDSDEEEAQPRTYMQEQAALKSDLVKALHDAADEASAASDEEDEEDDESFLKAKKKGAADGKAKQAHALPDPSTADRDPENYLSNFFAARAWVPTSTSRFAHLESDDDSADERADQFENAYNLRFEDPATSNTTLKTHARDVVAAVSVRRDEAMNPRKRARERVKLEKEREREEREAEKSRLRKLKMEEMEGKLERIRYAAGGGDVDIADWAGVLQEDWDGETFEKEMQKRFGDAYYAGKDEGMASEDDEEGDSDENGRNKKKKAQPKKPTWDDDIDIKDLVSDFEDDESAPALSDNYDEEVVDATTTTENEPIKAGPKKKSKTQSKRDRRLLESLAQQSTDLSLATSSSKKSGKTGKEGPRFAYRETSPTTFGLTALDILAADDKALNEWAGLKKLASFREEGKKEKDRRRLGKKGRLREWRKETFGSKEGPEMKDWYLEGAEVPKEGGEKVVEDAEGGVDIREGGKKKKRKRSKKGKGVKA